MVIWNSRDQQYACAAAPTVRQLTKHADRRHLLASTHKAAAKSGMLVFLAQAGASMLSVPSVAEPGAVYRAPDINPLQAASVPAPALATPAAASAELSPLGHYLSLVALSQKRLSELQQNAGASGALDLSALNDTAFALAQAYEGLQGMNAAQGNAPIALPLQLTQLGFAMQPSQLNEELETLHVDSPRLRAAFETDRAGTLEQLASAAQQLDQIGANLNPAAVAQNAPLDASRNVGAFGTPTATPGITAATAGVQAAAPPPFAQQAEASAPQNQDADQPINAAQLLAARAEQEAALQAEAQARAQGSAAAQSAQDARRNAEQRALQARIDATQQAGAQRQAQRLEAAQQDVARVNADRNAAQTAAAQQEAQGLDAARQEGARTSGNATAAQLSTAQLRAAQLEAERLETARLAANAANPAALTQEARQAAGRLAFTREVANVELQNRQLDETQQTRVAEAQATAVRQLTSTREEDAAATALADRLAAERRAAVRATIEEQLNLERVQRQALEQATQLQQAAAIGSAQQQQLREMQGQARQAQQRDQQQQSRRDAGTVLQRQQDTQAMLERLRAQSEADDEAAIRRASQTRQTQVQAQEQTVASTARNQGVPTTSPNRQAAVGGAADAQIIARNAANADAAAEAAARAQASLASAQPSSVAGPPAAPPTGTTGAAATASAAAQPTPNLQRSARDIASDPATAAAVAAYRLNESGASAGRQTAQAGPRPEPVAPVGPVRGSARASAVGEGNPNPTPASPGPGAGRRPR